MGYFKALSQSIDNAQRLKELHQYIERHNVPVTSKDDLSHQIIEIERYMGGSTYANLDKRKRVANIMTGILALPPLIFAFVLLFDRYQGYFGFGFDMGGTMKTIFLMTIEYLWAVILYAGVFAALVFYFYRLNSQAATQADKIIHALMTKSPSTINAIVE
ncbi:MULTISPECIES: DUF6097 family protein [unclassified Brenneria]|uniref:DUF6097 family protein n=1 Tax=unclassified Brenneria TaxID=2634434 RepID=UPI0029C26382|nr:MULTISPECIES: DUF6097 family protein [unclassified Brenneria]MDX5628142.1 DUF6097 family protein [Brenneria sp. L3-3Z]MDX5694838.1 DUF6097 family protein [Brenneria sp. L4-2C]MEE3660627.1 DUF6097 family protein [Brenneria sp. g21c3]